MPSIDDYLAAKTTLRKRCLGAGLRGNVIGRGPVLLMAAAASSARNNVHAVGIGAKISHGQKTTTRCVRLYVVQKIAPSKLNQKDLLPKEIDGIPTDVIESRPAFIGATACTTQRQFRQRPLVAGISAAHEDVTAGTIAYFCRSTKPGDDPAQVYLLSNNHVFANVNQASSGDALWQPGPLDGGDQADLVAQLHRFVRMRLGGQAINRVDAAIGALTNTTSFRRRICSIGRVTGTAQGVEDMRVRKHGRTSGHTEGIITDESYDALVGMDHNDPSIVALFEDQMRIERIAPHAAFGLGGDSGSLVVNKQKAAVGLYFAGPEAGDYGIANHIADVLRELQIELL